MGECILLRLYGLLWDTLGRYAVCSVVLSSFHLDILNLLKIRHLKSVGIDCWWRTQVLIASPHYLQRRLVLAAKHWLQAGIVTELRLNVETLLSRLKFLEPASRVPDVRTNSHYS